MFFSSLVSIKIDQSSSQLRFFIDFLDIMRVMSRFFYNSPLCFLWIIYDNSSTTSFLSTKNFCISVTKNLCFSSANQFILTRRNFTLYFFYMILISYKRVLSLFPKANTSFNLSYDLDVGWILFLMCIENEGMKNYQRDLISTKPELP